MKLPVLLLMIATSFALGGAAVCVALGAYKFTHDSWVSVCIGATIALLGGRLSHRLAVIESEP